MTAAVNFTATGVDFGIEADVTTLFDYTSYLKFKQALDLHDHTAGYGVACARIASCSVSAGNLTFATTSQRIRGDLSNATHASRVLLQSSTVDGNTNVGMIPNGASTVAQVVAYNAADASNAGRVQVGVSGTSARFLTGASGTGTEPATIDISSALGVLASIATATGVPTLCSATATPAAGSTSARLLFGTTAGFGIYYGSSAPTVSAAQGSLYLRSDGASSSTRLYVNNSAGSGTTWTGVTTAA